MKFETTVDEMTDIYSALTNWANQMEKVEPDFDNRPEVQRFIRSRVKRLRATRDKIKQQLKGQEVI